MTGKKIIQKIINEYDDLDCEIPILVVYRDCANCVCEKYEVKTASIVGGKLYIEADSMKRIPI